MKTPTALSVTSSQREQTSLRSQAPRLPRSNVCSTPDLDNPSASVHRKRFSTPSLTLKFLCAGKLNPPDQENACCIITGQLSPADWIGRGAHFQTPPKAQ